MKKFLRIFFPCLLALALLVTGVTLLYNKYLSKKLEDAAAALFTSDSIFACQLDISLKGEQDIRVEYGDTYREPGAKAHLIGRNITVKIPVKTTGKVDNTKTGTYVITYTAKFPGLTATASRNVHIVDTQLPQITLTVDPDAYTIPGQAYKEEGFRAIDNYDGDITDKVKSIEANGIMTYTVSDSSGNTFTTQRTIHYFDPGKPDIKLTGSDTYLLAQGDQFKDPGVTAIDPTDGDITSDVRIESDLDTNKPGRYTLAYIATNSHGFSSSVTRTVFVFPMECLVEETEEPTEPEETKAPTAPTAPTATTKPTYPTNCIIPEGGKAYKENGKTIYLTFDDGPCKNTQKLLDILALYDIDVSFFVRSSSYIDIIARAAQEGHTVAAHTNIHDYDKIYVSEDAFYADLSAIRTTIAKYTQNATPLIRFPGGSSNTISRKYNRGIMTRLTTALTEMGYTYFDWNVDSNDAGGAKTANEVFNNITNGVQRRKESVVLQHDTKEFSVDAVERVIAWGLVNGYTFKPLTEDSPTFHHPVNN